MLALYITETPPAAARQTLGRAGRCTTSAPATELEMGKSGRSGNTENPTEDEGCCFFSNSRGCGNAL